MRAKGDEALFAYTKQFDKVELTAETIRVTPEEIEEAYREVEPSLLDVIRKSLVNIRSYHEKQKKYSWFDTTENGTILGTEDHTAWNGRCLCAGRKGSLSVFCSDECRPGQGSRCRTDRYDDTARKRRKDIRHPLWWRRMRPERMKIYKVGGAQAIAALAYGTESIPKADKITGPGNIYVALAKRAVYGHVSIDSVAGPSEILVLADETATPRYVAADLLSQAEHDEMASAILVTTSKDAGRRGIKGDRRILERSFPEQRSSRSLWISTVLSCWQIQMADAIDAVNAIASEHLEIVTANPFEVMTKIRNAGAIFIGEYSSEPLGDYFAGPNHVLPTNGTAKFFSALSVDDFIKKSSIVYYSKEALEPIHEDIITFAEAEKLTAHANSIRVRFEK